MKVGVTGYKGRLGRYLLSHYEDFIGLECDVRIPSGVDKCILASNVDVILHLAAKSNVDYCQKPENEKEVIDTNLRGTFNVCRAGQLQGIPVVLLSSDHIFGGGWGRNREKDKGNPLNHYGFTKFSAESLRSVFDNLKVIRTSYLFDRERLNSQLSSLWSGLPEIYPTFITRTFMYYPHFAMTLCQYFRDLGRMPKVLHISGSKVVSWFGLVQEIGKQAGLDYKRLVLPRRVEYTNLAHRPLSGGLNTSLSKRLGLSQWSCLQGIEQMLKDWK